MPTNSARIGNERNRVNVIDIGMIDTPQMYFAVSHLGTCGGVQVKVPNLLHCVAIVFNRGGGIENRERTGASEGTTQHSSSLRTLREKLIKIGVKVVKHSWCVMFQMAEESAGQGASKKRPNAEVLPN